jgi:hypothetical protein
VNQDKINFNADLSRFFIHAWEIVVNPLSVSFSVVAHANAKEVGPILSRKEKLHDGKNTYCG